VENKSNAIASIGLAAMWLAATTCWAQAPPPASSTAASTALQYLQPSAVPAPLRAPLVALGNRLQTPGEEKFTLTGTYTDGSGSQGIKITWQIPGQVRIDLTGATPLSISSDGATTASSAGAVTPANDDLIETLGDDRAEALLFGVSKPDFGWRFVGGWFRTDDGTTQNYTGPFYHIHQDNAAVKVRSDKAQRNKFFYFDSTTSLLAEVNYSVERNGAAVNARTLYSGWTTVAGQAVPGQIVHSENGVAVITIQISSGQASAAANDSLFTTP